jgi:hypothetical protein
VCCWQVSYCGVLGGYWRAGSQMVARRKGGKAPGKGREEKCECCVGECRCIIKKAEGCWAATVRSGCQAAIVQKNGDWLQPGEVPVVAEGSEVGGRRAGQEWRRSERK